MRIRNPPPALFARVASVTQEIDAKVNKRQGGPHPSTPCLAATDDEGGTFCEVPIFRRVSADSYRATEHAGGRGAVPNSTSPRPSACWRTPSNWTATPGVTAIW